MIFLFLIRSTALGDLHGSNLKAHVYFFGVSGPNLQVALSPLIDMVILGFFTCCRFCGNTSTPLNSNLSTNQVPWTPCCSELCCTFLVSSAPGTRIAMANPTTRTIITYLLVGYTYHPQ